MQSLTHDIEKSVRTIFRLFFNTNVQLKNNNVYKYSPWGVDIIMDCGGVKKLSLFMDESTLKSVMKQLTGEDNIQNSALAYNVIGEIARFIAGNAAGEKHENFTIYKPVPSQGIRHSEHSQIFSSGLGEFAISLE
ncbi:MAG: hypothetical protein V1874_13990 [Spirochaetota bacterium]